jgi:hypothetical protein
MTCGQIEFDVIATGFLLFGFAPCAFSMYICLRPKKVPPVDPLEAKSALYSRTTSTSRRSSCIALARAPS